MNNEEQIGKYIVDDESHKQAKGKCQNNPYGARLELEIISMN